MTRYLALVGLLAFAAPAHAHEVLHEVRIGHAVAVRAWFPDGESLAYVQAEVFSPKDPAIPYWKGRTDRSGWLAFVPDVAGPWRVRIVDSTGHGLDTTVVVPATLGASQPVTGAEGAKGSTLAFILRPVAGAVVIAAIFGGLVLLRRRKGS